MKYRTSSLAAASVLLCMHQAALAQLPPSVRAMIDAAIATGDPKKVATVIELAKLTNPDAVDEIDQIDSEFASLRAEIVAAEQRAKEDAIRSAGVFEYWSGKGEIGAFRATGNSSYTGATAGLDLQRTGIDWRHKFRAQLNYQRTNGVTSREQYLAAYEPNYSLSDEIYLYGLTQYESDRFQGYSSRYSFSGGAGYRVLDREGAYLTVNAGPAYRNTQLLTGEIESELAALAAVDLDFSLTDRIKITEDASVYYQAGNSTYIAATGLEAGLGSGLAARLSYKVEHDSHPPLNAVKTDTHSRFTLIYGF
ncbi:MAG: DUF481 domain-containing protein [Allopontixanthobacter sediminis]